MTESSLPIHCVNCRSPISGPGITTHSGEFVCDYVCSQGWDNGQQMKKIIEDGIKWNAIFKKMGLDV